MVEAESCKLAEASMPARDAIHKWRSRSNMMEKLWEGPQRWQSSWSPAVYTLINLSPQYNRGQYPWKRTVSPTTTKYGTVLIMPFTFQFESSGLARDYRGKTSVSTVWTPGTTNPVKVSYTAICFRSWIIICSVHATKKVTKLLTQQKVSTKYKTLIQYWFCAFLTTNLQ